MTVFGPFKATVSAVHDGDTLDLDLLLIAVRKHVVGDTDFGFNVHRDSAGIWIRHQSVRLLGCNAPELATADGKAALAYLLTLLKVGDQVTLVSHGWDKYGGRIDGVIALADGRDLAAAMIAAGHAAAWDGKGAKPVPGVAA